MRVLPRALAVLAALVLPLTLAAVWTDQVATDTPGYVETVVPIADDPEVQDAAAARVAAASSGLLRARLGDEAASASGRVTEEVAARVVASDVFADSWEAANRTAHRELRRQLRSQSSGSVVLDLSRVVAAVLEEVVASPEVADALEGALGPGGIDAASSLRVRLAKAEETDRLRTAYASLDVLGILGAVLWLFLLLGALVLGADRRAVIAFAAGWSALTCALLWVAVFVGQDAVAARVSATDRAVVRAVIDVVTDDLQLWALVAAGLSALVTVLAAVWPRRPAPARA